MHKEGLGGRWRQKRAQTTSGVVCVLVEVQGGLRWAMTTKTGTNDARRVVCVLGTSFLNFYLLINDFIFYLDSSHVPRCKEGLGGRLRRKRAQTTPDASFVSSLRYKEGLGGR